jgi:multidrug efflux pump subunit AcrA (membrane-fusion protein)
MFVYLDFTKKGAREMNANELADILQQSGFLAMDFAEDAATMLRQQQAEIEALKQIIDANNLNQNIGQFVKPTNEPVAYMDKKGFVITNEESAKEHGFAIPLYTHPVKELTEPEIHWLAQKYFDSELGIDPIKFARAILRKAVSK